MALAILLGLCAGFVGFLPMFFALRSYRKVLDNNSTMRLAGYSLGAFLLSLVILALALFACSRIAHDQLLPFGCAEVVMLLVSTIAYVVSKNRSGKSAAGKKERGQDTDG